MSSLEIIAIGISQTDITIPQGEPGGTTLQTLLRIVTGTLGAVAFLIIVIAGFKYTLSRGNPDEITKAKETIIYAVAGLLISMAAFSIVTFVVGRT